MGGKTGESVFCLPKVSCGSTKQLETLFFDVRFFCGNRKNALKITFVSLLHIKQRVISLGSGSKRKCLCTDSYFPNPRPRANPTLLGSLGISKVWLMSHIDWRPSKVSFSLFSQVNKMLARGVTVHPFPFLF